MENTDKNQFLGIIETGVSLQKTCRDCGDTFFVTKENASYYLDHDYAMPKRCRVCQKIKKLARPYRGEYANANFTPMP